ncbi:MAG: hypothetical protein ACWGON_11530 [Gemmatimonadota bacterium]
MTRRVSSQIALVGVLLLAVSNISCSDGPALETRTFELMYLDDDVASELVAPYVYFDREGANGAMTVTEGKLTVRETTDNLDRIGRVLAEFDTPKPGVRLRFQLIEADGFESTDPEIMEVENALRDVFRFEGYQLIGEALINGIAGSWVQQDVPSDDGVVFRIHAGISSIRTDSEGGSVQLQVELQAWGDALLGTSLRVRSGQTAVLGSAALRTGEASDRTLILAVRPEIIERP